METKQARIESHPAEVDFSFFIYNFNPGGMYFGEDHDIQSSFTLVGHLSRPRSSGSDDPYAARDKTVQFKQRGVYISIFSSAKDWPDTEFNNEHGLEASYGEMVIDKTSFLEDSEIDSEDFHHMYPLRVQLVLNGGGFDDFFQRATFSFSRNIL
jgi:hypothetical protein